MRSFSFLLTVSVILWICYGLLGEGVAPEGSNVPVGAGLGPTGNETRVEGLPTEVFAHTMRAEEMAKALAWAEGEGQIPDQPAQRVVVLGPSTVDALFLLGVGGRIVGVSDYCIHEGAAEIPRVGGLQNANLERIAALRPDLILVQGQNQRLQELAKQLGIGFVETHGDTVSDWDRTILQLGVQFHLVETALEKTADLWEPLTQCVIAVEEKKQRGEYQELTCLLVIGRQADAVAGLTIAGRDSFLGFALKCAGGILVPDADYTRHWYDLAEEALIRAAPQIIFECGPIPTTTGTTPLELWQKAFPELPAVKNGRVYALTDPSVTIPGPRMVETAKLFQKCLFDQLTK